MVGFSQAIDIFCQRKKPSWLVDKKYTDTNIHTNKDPNIDTNTSENNLKWWDCPISHLHFLSEKEAKPVNT